MITIIQTGGTIASVPSEAGFKPIAGGAFEDLVRHTAEALGEAVSTEPLTDANGQVKPPRDSCEFTPEDWVDLNRQIKRANAEGSNGIVVLHGTDTMAYTASALALMGAGSTAPVVLTGAQIPFSAVGSDARANIELALSAVVGRYGRIENGVLLAFHYRLMRGIRASKVSSRAHGAFAAPGFELRTDQLDAYLGVTHAAPVTEPAVRFDGKVVSLNITPATDMQMIGDWLLQAPVGGLLLNLYGTGSAPQVQQLLALCEKLVDKGWLIMARSSCPDGEVQWDRYAATAGFNESSVINGRDITQEAASVKLAAAFGRANATEWLSSNIAGEFG